MIIACRDLHDRYVGTCRYPGQHRSQHFLCRAGATVLFKQPSQDMANDHYFFRGVAELGGNPQELIIGIFLLSGVIAHPAVPDPINEFIGPFCVDPQQIKDIAIAFTLYV